MINYIHSNKSNIHYTHVHCHRFDGFTNMLNIQQGLTPAVRVLVSLQVYTLMK